MRGASLLELTIALALLLIVAGGIAHVAGDADAAFRAQPEAADLLQRARVALDALTAEVSMAGGGPFLLPDASPLVRWLPPVFPRRLGRLRPDPDTSAFDDRLTILTVPDKAPQAYVAAMASAADPIALRAGAWCPRDDPACGFEPDQQTLVFDATAAFDLFVVRDVRPLTVQPDTPLSKRYVPEQSAGMAGVRATTYAFDRTRLQLRRYDGHRSDVPLVDHVVAFAVRYYGDPFPPLAPIPPAGEGNCVIDRDGRARLPVEPAAFGVLVELPLARLADGPWCGVEPQRFDADLYRVRQVRIRLRVEAGSEAVRGPVAQWFVNPGRAVLPASWVPDLELSVDVAPRNLRGL
jgi:type II secretory pathway pseudopilin PulG